MKKHLPFIIILILCILVYFSIEQPETNTQHYVVVESLLFEVEAIDGKTISFNYSMTIEQVDSVLMEINNHGGVTDSVSHLISNFIKDYNSKVSR